jgi:fatty acid/phospholipid biosynthesis enzyme
LAFGWPEVTGASQFHADGGEGLERPIRVYNGASLVGLNGIVVKSHGSANSLAFAHAINQATLEVEQNIPQLIRQHVADLLQDRHIA